MISKGFGKECNWFFKNVSSGFGKDLMDSQRNWKGFGKEFDWFSTDFQLVSEGFGEEFEWFAKEFQNIW